ncbi:MAG: hypothetical protein IID41_10355 [Planctomycetes bacterium]|nr:hypothetical protein [Planctomycetota bacterium]
MAIGVETEADSKEAERTSEPQRPPAFIWKRPFPLNDRIGHGTLCVTRPILCFDDDTPDAVKRGDVLHAWPRLQGDVHVSTKNGEHIGRIVGLDKEHLYLHCPCDLGTSYVEWDDLTMLCEVVPFPLPQVCEMGGAA